MDHEFAIVDVNPPVIVGRDILYRSFDQVTFEFEKGQIMLEKYRFH
jgi:hypothetical protein